MKNLLTLLILILMTIMSFNACNNATRSTATDGDDFNYFVDFSKKNTYTILVKQLYVEEIYYGIRISNTI
jgi:hypothetical protein